MRCLLQMVRLVAKKPMIPGYPTDPQTLGEHLKKRRMDLGLLQREAAELFGISYAMVVHWEKGHFWPRHRYWPAIYRFLGYDPESEPKMRGEKTHRLRQLLGWNQKQLARYLAIDPTNLWYWEVKGKGADQTWSKVGREVEKFLDLERVRSVRRGYRTRSPGFQT